MDYWNNIEDPDKPADSLFECISQRKNLSNTFQTSIIVASLVIGSKLFLDDHESDSVLKASRQSRSVLRSEDLTQECCGRFTNSDSNLASGLGAVIQSPVIWFRSGMNTVTRTVRKAMRKDSIQRQVLGHAATVNWKFTRLVRTNGFHPDFTVANRRTLQSGYVTSSFSDTNTRTNEQVTKRHLLTELGSIRFYTLLGQDSYTNHCPVLTICFVEFEARK